MRSQLLHGLAAVAVAATGCGASSGGTPVAAPASNAATPAPIASASGLQAGRAPSGFPAGDYARTVKLQGELDGRWRLTLRTDGRYAFTDPQGRPLEGTFDVTGARIVLHDAECGDGTYTFVTTTTGLAFTEVAADACQDDRHALLAGQEWTKAT